jgi:DNA-binding response OmpR family regulator
MNRRILVVDDEPEFSGLLQFRLRSHKYEVESAANGAEALEKIAHAPPDIILLDLMLPDLDGLTLCEILRRREASRTTPIIMITALVTTAAKCSAKIAGARAFQAKPLDFEDLLMQLEFLLATRDLPSDPLLNVQQINGASDENAKQQSQHHGQQQKAQMPTPHLRREITKDEFGQPLHGPSVPRPADDTTSYK